MTAERDGLRGERDAAALGREAALAGAQRLRASERSAREEARALRLQVEGLQEGLAKSQREADDFTRSLEEVLGEAEVIVDENRSLTRGYNLLRNCLLQNLRVMEPNISALGAVAPARDFPLGGSSPNVPAMAGRLSILCEALGPASRSFGDSCAKTAWLEVFARLHSAEMKGWEEAVVKAGAAGSSDQRAKLPKTARQIAQNFQKSFWEARGREDARQLLLGRLRGTEPAAPVAPEVNPTDEQVGTVYSLAPEFTRASGSKVFCFGAGCRAAGLGSACGGRRAGLGGAAFAAGRSYPRRSGSLARGGSRSIFPEGRESGDSLGAALSCNGDVSSLRCMHLPRGCYLFRGVL